MQRKTANFFGICGSSLLQVFWLMLLTSSGRSHGFVGDISVIKGAMLLGFEGCAIAAFRGSPWWWIAFAVSLTTTILVVVIAPV
jgi:hypothetical protein